MQKKKGILFVYLKPYPLVEMFKHELNISKNITRSGIILFKYIINGILEKYILKNSDIIIPISMSYLNYLNQSKGINKQKMLPIPMGFNSEALKIINEQKVSQIRQEYCPDSEKLLLYFGVFHRRRNLDFIINVFDQTTKENPNIKLLMIGGNKNEHNNILNTIEKGNLAGQIILLEAMRREELYNYIAAADLTLSPIPPLFIYRISSPTKVIESLGCGTPVIVNEEIEDQHQIIVKSNGGYSVPYDENSFSNAIIKLLSNNIKLKEMGKSGQKYILENRTYEKLGKELELFILKKMKYEKLKSQE